MRSRRTKSVLLAGVAAAALSCAQGTSAADPGPPELSLGGAAVPAEHVRPAGIEEARRESARFDAPPGQARTADTDTGSRAAVGSGGSYYTPLTPVRVLDTRTAGGPLGPSAQRLVVLPPQVPDEATAVVLNVTGVSPTAGTFLTLWPSSAARPEASNVNLRAGEIRANAVTVALGVDGHLNLVNRNGSTDVVIDLAGYYAPTIGDGFFARSPARVLDTRAAGGPLAPGGTRTIDLSGAVPSTARAVTLTLTGASATAGTFVTAWPTGAPRPTASALNLVPGQVTPNQVTVALGGNRSVTLYNNSGTTHLVADLAGYYAADGAAFYQMTPLRVLDTRLGEPLPGGYSGDVDLSADLPAPATAVTFNLTGTEPSTSTYLTAFPAGTDLPTASNLNLAPGQTAANLVTVALGGRSVSVYNLAGHTHFLMDVAGYFAPPPTPCATACVHSWGDNAEAQLGVGTTGGWSTAPGRVDGFSGFTAVTAGFYNGYALAGTGSVWAWGDNVLGGLGNGRPYGTGTVPSRVGSLTGVTQIAAGSFSTYALDSSHRVWAWGHNGDGSLGDGTTTTRLSPVRVGIAGEVTQVAAGYTTAYALRADGTVWAWGSNGGSLGDGSYGTGCSSSPVGAGCRAVTPVQVPGLSGVVSIAATRNAAFAVKSDGTVWAWGYNAHGELGLGTAGGPACYDDPFAANCLALSPVRVPGLTGVAKVVSGSISSTYALTADGTVLSWGWNGEGQLGNGTAGGECPDPSQPDCVGTTPAAVPGLTGVADVAGGAGYVMARRTDGTVWTWGVDSQGQLGGHTVVFRPGQVPGLTGVTAIGSGGATSLAVR